MNTGSRCSMHQTGSWSRSVVLARVRRVALALLDGQPVLDLVALRVVQADAEHVGVGELVHALVELAEDRLEVERRGDLAPDVAQQLDVLLALALGPGQLLGGLGAEPRLGELRALALLADDPPALHAVHAEDAGQAQQQVAGIGPPGAVPRRQDGERVRGLLADLAEHVARAHVEAVVAESRGSCSRGAPRASRPTSRRRGPSSRVWYSVAVSSRKVGAANSNRSALDDGSSRGAATAAIASAEEDCASR